MKNTIKQFLQSTLQNIILEPPLFYNNDIGLRFELGVPYRELEDPSYFETVHHRSKELFDSVFSNTDEIFLVMKTYQPLPPLEVINPGVKVFSNYVDPEVAKEVTCYEKEPVIDEDTNEVSGHLRSFGLLCSLSDVNYKGILRAIGYIDFPSNGDYISDRIYFIHPTKHIVFHMYDDRGLDIVALDKEELQPLFNQYRQWVLDYDRATIEKKFGR
ncbi:MAG: DUF3885 domain-containing protein [Paenibacillaceae bacterium]